MPLTVTATQGNDPANGLLLRVTVLTGAAAVQPGATASHQSPGSFLGSAAATVTTTQPGSRVYGALLHSYPFPGAFTANAATVLDDNVVDSINGRVYGTCKAAALTVTPGAVTIGASGPTQGGPPGVKYLAAVAEILADGTLAEDPSSPAPALTESATTVTTGSFDPPPGSLLVARVSSNGGTGIVRMTVDGGGLSWAPLIELAGIQDYYTGVWAAQV